MRQRHTCRARPTLRGRVSLCQGCPTDWWPRCLSYTSVSFRARFPITSRGRAKTYSLVATLPGSVVRTSRTGPPESRSAHTSSVSAPSTSAGTGSGTSSKCCSATGSESVAATFWEFRTFSIYSACATNIENCRTVDPSPRRGNAWCTPGSKNGSLRVLPPRAIAEINRAVAKTPLVQQLETQPHVGERPFANSHNHRHEQGVVLVDEASLDRLGGERRAAHADVPARRRLQLPNRLTVERPLDSRPGAGHRLQGLRVHDSFGRSGHCTRRTIDRRRAFRCGRGGRAAR